MGPGACGDSVAEVGSAGSQLDCSGLPCVVTEGRLRGLLEEGSLGGLPEGSMPFASQRQGRTVSHTGPFLGDFSVWGCRPR